MFFKLRPFIAASLVLALSVGHLPGWLHVGAFADADGCGTGEISRPASGHCCCSHSHPAARPSESLAGGSTENDGRPIQPEHDSDGCAVCQSLYVTNGVPGSIGEIADCPTVIQSLLIVSARLDLIESRRRPPARGPPVVNA